MLKITVKNDDHQVAMRLEGRLIGPWVGEVERSWREVNRHNGSLPALIDLTDVTFINAEGKKLLGRIYRAGAELRAGALMKLTLEQIKKGTKRP